MKSLKGFLVVDIKYPIWAIKRNDDEVEHPVNPHGHPGFDHALWYWWQLRTGGSLYQKLTWEAAMNRLEFHNQHAYSRNSYRYDPYGKVAWERLSEDIWRVLYEIGGNRTVLGSLTRLDKIENPESTYRWYRE